MDEEDCAAYIRGVRSSFSGPEGAEVIIVDASEDSTAAVNSLLQNGKKVSVITEGRIQREVSCVIMPHGKVLILSIS